MPVAQASAAKGGARADTRWWKHAGPQNRRVGVATFFEGGYVTVGNDSPNVGAGQKKPPCWKGGATGGFLSVLFGASWRAGPETCVRGPGCRVFRPG